MCVLTLLLNGRHFLPHHAAQLPRLSSELDWDWEWHVVEGVAQGRPYSSEALPQQFYSSAGRSVDGSSEYVDQLAAMYPGQVHVTRTSDGGAWRDKLRMVNAALEGMDRSCVLAQVDVDELWTAEALVGAAEEMRAAGRRCSYVDCQFFIAPELVTVTQGAYSHQPYEWLRLWEYEPGRMHWYDHAPPTMATLDAATGNWIALNGDRCRQRAPGEAPRFAHHAYVLPEQVAFKEKFYGYEGALAAWERLAATPPSQAVAVEVGRFLPWIPPGVRVEAAPLLPEVPRTQRLPQHVVVDAVVFQLQRRWRKGIPRVWREVLPRLAAALQLDDRLTVVLRGRTAEAELALPARAEVVRAAPHDEEHPDWGQMTRLCRRLGATVFLSTYFTRCDGGARNVLLVHDVVPEQFGWPGSWWEEKRRIIPLADAVVTVSQASADALAERYPGVRPRWAPNGVSDAFSAPHIAPVVRSRPYVLLVGSQGGYKNGHVAVAALRLLSEETRPLLVQVGGGGRLEGVDEYHVSFLSDEALASEYAGALALLYMSIAEGFGLPVAEALAVGCPVVASDVPALREAGPSAVFVTPGSAQQVAEALVRLSASPRPGRSPGASWGALAEALAASSLPPLN